MLLMNAMIMTAFVFVLPQEADALANKKVPKNITLYAVASGQTQVDLKWNKIKSPSKGYAVFRDGEAIAHYNTKKITFTDKGLEAGISYIYRIKTYTKKTVKMWFNKKTEKWQKKKPAKKYRGKSKKKVVYTYKKKSNAVTVQTAAAPAPSTLTDSSDADGNANSESAQKTYTITWKNYDGTVLNTTIVNQGDIPVYVGDNPTKPEKENYTYSFIGWTPEPTAVTGNAIYEANFKAIQFV